MFSTYTKGAPMQKKAACTYICVREAPLRPWGAYMRERGASMGNRGACETYRGALMQKRDTDEGHATIGVPPYQRGAPVMPIGAPTCERGRLESTNCFCNASQARACAPRPPKKLARTIRNVLISVYVTNKVLIKLYL